MCSRAKRIIIGGFFFFTYYGMFISVKRYMCISFLVFFLEWIRHMCQDIIPTKDSILYNTRYPINRNSINPFEFSREIHHSCAHPPFHVLPFDTTRNESRRPTCQTERKFESRFYCSPPGFVASLQPAANNGQPNTRSL